MTSRPTRFAISLAAVMLATPATATTFLTITPASGTANVRLVNNGTGVPDQASNGNGARLYATTTGAAQSPGLAAVTLGFATGPLAALGAIPGWFQLDASSSTPATVDAGLIRQTGFDGFLRFTSRAPLQVGSTLHASGTELLRADFTGAALGGSFGASSASFASATGGTLDYTSTFLNFGSATDLGFSLAIGSLLTSLHVAGAGTTLDPYRAVRSFRGNASGTASATASIATSAVPEPETWAMLVAGLAMIGIQQRRRPRTLRIAG